MVTLVLLFRTSGYICFRFLCQGGSFSLTCFVTCTWWIPHIPIWVSQHGMADGPLYPLTVASISGTWTHGHRVLPTSKLTDLAVGSHLMHHTSLRHSNVQVQWIYATYTPVNMSQRKIHRTYSFLPPWLKTFLSRKPSWKIAYRRKCNLQVSP